MTTLYSNAAAEALHTDKQRAKMDERWRCEAFVPAVDSHKGQRRIRPGSIIPEVHQTGTRIISPAVLRHHRCRVNNTVVVVVSIKDSMTGGRTTHLE